MLKIVGNAANEKKTCQPITKVPKNPSTGRFNTSLDRITITRMILRNVRCHFLRK